MKSAFPGFAGVLVSHLDPSWIRALGFDLLEHKPGSG